MAEPTREEALAELRRAETALEEGLSDAQAQVERMEISRDEAQSDLDHAEENVTKIEQRLGLTRDLIAELEVEL